jgi:hypothetical protein
MVLIKLILIGIAMVVAAFYSSKISLWNVGSNRKVEFPENKLSEPLTEPELHWTLVHIRDDLGSIHTILVLTNALVAGILATLIIMIAF